MAPTNVEANMTRCSLDWDGAVGRSSFDANCFTAEQA